MSSVSKKFIATQKTKAKAFKTCLTFTMMGKRRLFIADTL